MHFSSPIKAVLISGIVLGSSMAASAETSGWMGVRDAAKYAKNLEKKNQLPVSMSCRNDPKHPKLLKIHVKITSKPNRSKKDWAMFGYVGGLFWMPDLAKNWKMLYKKRWSLPTSGKKANCSLWHYKLKAAPNAKRGKALLEFRTEGLSW